MTTLPLPVTGGGTRAYTPRDEPPPTAPGGPPLASRTVFSAAHVVADPFADVSPD
ncbi:dihydrodipicolinate synthase family protein, partial [Streptomyces sp. SID10115]|nr:dihydrodipicolinate synthase family protein [Streptomyces sp. SID10115]